MFFFVFSLLSQTLEWNLDWVWVVFSGACHGWYRLHSGYCAFLVISANIMLDKLRVTLSLSLSLSLFHLLVISGQLSRKKFHFDSLILSNTSFWLDANLIWFSCSCRRRWRRQFLLLFLARFTKCNYILLSRIFTLLWYYLAVVLFYLDSLLLLFKEGRRRRKRNLCDRAKTTITTTTTIIIFRLMSVVVVVVVDLRFK